MNGVQSRKPYTTEKPVPGCLGRMVTLFDLSSGVAGNKMLTDKPHRDGSFLSHISLHFVIKIFLFILLSNLP